MSIHESTFILWYCCVVAGVVGAVLGSFLHCTAYRVVRGQPFFGKERSRCPSCGHELGALDLVPVFSWLLLGGRCRYCKAKVPLRYFVAECFMAAMAVLCLLRFDLSVVFLRNLVFGCCLFCLALVDLENMTIPNGCLLAALFAWAAALPFLGQPLNWVFGRIAAGAVFGGGLLLFSLAADRVLGRESMGGGDIKLFAVVGLYLGFVGTLFCLVLACVLGLVFAAVTKSRGKPFPFGPSIAAAAWVMLLYGDGLVNWYLGLLGV